MSEAAPIRTTCAYCGVGCGVLATPQEDGGVRIAGDPDHPANRGRLCSKGTHLGETVGLAGRLLRPMIGDRPAGWDKALDLVARRFADTIARHGPDSVAFYVSGQLLTEDYYVANKLMKGFIGSANIDTNSRLCMSSAVAGHVRAFGEDIVPASYDDLDEADLIVLIGSNTAVIPLQNGIDSFERLIPILGVEHVMCGVAQISATIAAPGVVHQTGTFMRLVFGEVAGGLSARGDAFLAMCKVAGFDATHSGNILTDLWLKYILLATNSAITAATRQPFGKLRGDADIMAMFEAGFGEVYAVGKAKGIALPDNTVENMVKATKAFPDTMMASMAHDLIRGGRIELPWLSGKVVAMGRELGVPTPVHNVLHAMLKPHTMGNAA